MSLCEHERKRHRDRERKQRACEMCFCLREFLSMCSLCFRGKELWVFQSRGGDKPIEG